MSDEPRADENLLQSGDTVTIYEDPISKIVPEGKAKLIERISVESNGEMWFVKFEGDEQIVTRKVCK